MGKYDDLAKVASVVAMTNALTRVVSDPVATRRLTDHVTAFRVSVRGAPWPICTADLTIHPDLSTASSAYYDRALNRVNPGGRPGDTAPSDVSRETSSRD